MTRQTYAHLAEGFGIYVGLFVGMPACMTKEEPAYYARLAAHFGLLALQAQEDAKELWREAALSSKLSDRWAKEKDSFSSEYYANEAAEYAKLAEIEEMR